ncbi:MAG: hypothetical protein ACW98X_21335, partial [Promethearchaeota archaeon]
KKKDGDESPKKTKKKKDGDESPKKIGKKLKLKLKKDGSPKKTKEVIEQSIEVENKDTNDKPTRRNIKKITFEKPIQTVETVLKCPYFYKKGLKMNSTCDDIPVPNKVYCFHHRAFEGSDQQHRIIEKISVLGSIDIDGIRNDKGNIVISKNEKVGVSWNECTQIAFEYRINKYVAIGKCVDDKLECLKPIDIKECEKHEFEYDEPKIISKEVVDTININNGKSCDIVTVLKTLTTTTDTIKQSGISCGELSEDELSEDELSEDELSEDEE